MVSLFIFILVDPDRFELPLRANLALTDYKPAFLPLEDGSIGVLGGTRTRAILIKSQVLYQLSYEHRKNGRDGGIRTRMVIDRGVLSTFCKPVPTHPHFSNLIFLYENLKYTNLIFKIYI